MGQSIALPGTHAGITRAHYRIWTAHAPIEHGSAHIPHQGGGSTIPMPTPHAKRTRVCLGTPSYCCLPTGLLSC